MSRAHELACRPLDGETASGWLDVMSLMLRAAHGEEAPVLEGAGREDAAAQRSAATVLEGLAGLGLTASAGILLPDAFRDATVQPVHLERPGRVQVMAADRVRSRRFRALVVAGLTADEFPRGRGSGAEDAVASMLAGAGVRARGTSDLAAERLLFYLSITRARERLALSCQTANADGRPFRTSPFWEEVLDLYRDPVEPEIAKRLPGLPETRRVVLFEEMGPADTSGLTGRKALRARAARRKEPDARHMGLFGAEAVIGHEEALAALAERTVFSASEVEAYVRCPRRWFFEHALAPRPVGRELGARERGMLAHDALRIVYERLAERTGEDRVTPGTLEHALVLADEALDEALAVQLAPATLDEDDSVRAARERVRVLLCGDAVSFGGFVPMSLEWGFGIDGGADAIDLGGFALKGRVDRIDRSADGLLVMDYKWGKTVAHKRFEKDGLVQLPLYARAVCLAFGLPVAGAFYRSLSDGGNRGFHVRGLVPAPGKAAGGSIVDADEAEAIISAAVERANAAVEGIREGRVPADPVNEDACRWCIVAGLCEGSVS